MIELMLMRHAKSDWQSHTADLDRPLNNRGSQDALAMGAYLARKGLVPEKIIVSPAKRTRQTAELMLESLRHDVPQVVVDKELYLASAETMRELIEYYAADTRRLLVLAHNPGMDMLVSYLASSPPALSDSGKLMPTCAVACFQLDSVEALQRPAGAELQGLFRPKEIAESN